MTQPSKTAMDAATKLDAMLIENVSLESGLTIEGAALIIDRALEREREAVREILKISLTAFNDPSRLVDKPIGHRHSLAVAVKAYYQQLITTQDAGIKEAK